MAGTGHDAYAFDMWTVQQWAEKLEPVDDIMKALIDKYGPTIEGVDYLAQAKGHWMAVPTGSGSSPLACWARISMLKQYAGIDVQAMYPAHEGKPSDAAAWTYDTFLRAAEACHKAGYGFALGLGQTTDSVQTWGAIFGAFGADLVDGQGKITVDSDNVRNVLEYARKLVPFLPADSGGYDHAAHNRAPLCG